MLSMVQTCTSKTLNKYMWVKDIKLLRRYTVKSCL